LEELYKAEYGADAPYCRAFFNDRVRGILVNHRSEAFRKEVVRRIKAPTWFLPNYLRPHGVPDPEKSRGKRYCSGDSSE
jgi:hypothetical protein